MNSEVLGVILAGGQARRMGGGDKCLKTVYGVPILERLMTVLAPQVHRVILNANGDPERFSDYDIEVVSDEAGRSFGPLSGVLAGLGYARAHTSCQWVMTVAGDTPFIPSDLVGKCLQKAQSEAVRIVQARSGGRDHPVIALWSVDLLDELEKAFRADQPGSVRGWIARYPHRSVEWVCSPGDPFFNINAEKDLEGL